MSDMTGPGAPDETPKYTEAQQAFLAHQAATHAAEAPSPAADQAAAAAQMTERGPALPAETDIEQLMAALRTQSEQITLLQLQVGVMQQQADERSAAEGGPPVIRYAQAAADKLAATAAAHPDLGNDHFAAPLAAAGDLTAAAAELVKSGGTAAAVEAAAAKMERWLTVTHWRTGRKFIDFSALADDVATAVEEALKLVA